jgi:ribosome maturation factor RimP
LGRLTEIKPIRSVDLSERELEQIQERIEERLRISQPDVELLALERPAAERLRLVIDRDAGVDLELCETVTRLLPDLNEEWAIEVTSPGPERPLTKPEHFQRFLGSTVRVKTKERLDGRRSFTGRLEDADESEVSLVETGGTVTIPLGIVSRSNLLDDSGAEGERPESGSDTRQAHANEGMRT